MKRWRFLAVISAAQLALLLAHLGRDSLWLDEVTSADVAGAPWGRVWAFFRSLPEQHPLYYLLLRGWTILGTSEATLRSLSVGLAFAILRDWPVRAAWRKTVGAQLAVAIAYSPWVLLLATHRPEPQAWKGPATIVFGIPYTLLRFSLGYSEFLANAGWKNRVPELVAGNAVLLVVALVVFGVLAVVGWRELWRAGRDGRFVLCGLVVPMAAALLASLRSEEHTSELQSQSNLVCR